jgi:hypothetical protein
MPYAARGVSWQLVLAGCAAIAMVMAVVAVAPDVMWPLQGAALGLLAAMAAWTLDEVAAPLVDTLPRPLWWRTAARALAVVPLALTWTGCVLLLRHRLPPHPELFLLQGFAALLLAVAFVTWRRARGDAVPGTRFASAVVPVAAMIALIRPVSDRVPVFPIWAYENWDRSRTIWCALAAGSAVLLAFALWDMPARRAR